MAGMFCFSAETDRCHVLERLELLLPHMRVQSRKPVSPLCSNRENRAVCVVLREEVALYLPVALKGSNYDAKPNGLPSLQIRP